MLTFFKTLDRICKEYGLYFAAKSHLVLHNTFHRKERQNKETFCQEMDNLVEVS